MHFYAQEVSETEQDFFIQYIRCFYIAISSYYVHTGIQSLKTNSNFWVFFYIIAPLNCKDGNGNTMLRQHDFQHSSAITVK